MDFSEGYGSSQEFLLKSQELVRTAQDLSVILTNSREFLGGRVGFS